MCPLCIGVATWYFAGASSAGSIAALVLKRSSVRNHHNRECGITESKRDPKGIRPYRNLMRRAADESIRPAKAAPAETD
jgi:hypothetical protein